MRDQLARLDRRVRRDVVDRLLRIERGALPAGLAERVDQHADSFSMPSSNTANSPTGPAPTIAEAVDDGVMAKIVVPEGTTDVPVNQLIAVMAQEGEDPKAAAAAAGKDAAPAPSVSPPSPQRGEGTGQPAAAPASAPQTIAPSAPPSPLPRGERSPPQAAGEGVRTNGHDAGPSGANRIFSSPLARRLAKEAGIDLGRIAGSGPHGRVIARDVAAAKEGKGLRAPVGAPQAAAGGAPRRGDNVDQQIRALYEDGSYDFVPHDGMRRTIAQRLTASMQTIPHFY